MRVKKDVFIEQYVSWLKTHLSDILPKEASEFRMVELARRQHNHDINHLINAMKSTGYISKE